MVSDFKTLKTVRVKALDARFNALKSKAIVAVGVNRDPVVLDYVGNAISYWMDLYTGDDPEFDVGDGCDTPGLWYVEGTIRSNGHGFFEDYEEWWANSVSRKLTTEEQQEYSFGRTPFYRETAAEILWKLLEEADEMGLLMHINWPVLYASFPDPVGENFTDRTTTQITVGSPNKVRLYEVIAAKRKWDSMQRKAEETKKILREKAKREDPEWEDPDEAPQGCIGWSD